MRVVTEFFATTSDLATGMVRAEQVTPVYYVRSKVDEHKAIEVFHSHLDLSLDSPGSVQSPRQSPEYLLFPAGTHVEATAIPQRDGSVLFDVSEVDHPEALLFRPCGRHQTGALFGGVLRCTTNNPDSPTLSLYKNFANNVFQGFLKLKCQLGHYWWIGPEALSMLKTGVRFVPRNIEHTWDDLVMPPQRS
jgi:hypothetical protein